MGQAVICGISETIVLKYRHWESPFSPCTRGLSLQLKSSLPFDARLCFDPHTELQFCSPWMVILLLALAPWWMLQWMYTFEGLLQQNSFEEVEFESIKLQSCLFSVKLSIKKENQSQKRMLCFYRKERDERLYLKAWSGKQRTLKSMRQFVGLKNPSPMIDNVTLLLDIGCDTATCFLIMSVTPAKGDLKSSFPSGVFNFHQVRHLITDETQAALLFLESFAIEKYWTNSRTRPNKHRIFF